MSELNDGPNWQRLSDIPDPPPSRWHFDDEGEPSIHLMDGQREIAWLPICDLGKPALALDWIRHLASKTSVTTRDLKDLANIALREHRTQRARSK